MASRLLIVSFSVCPGPDRHGVGLLNVLKALAPRYAVDVVTLRVGELPFVERFMKARMLRVPVGTGGLAEQVEAFGRAVRRQLEGEEYDLVHLRSAWGGRAVLNGIQSPGRLVYEVARSIEGEPRAADEQLAKKLQEEEDACLERADLTLVPTEGARERLGGRVAPRLVEVVPPGVDVDHFDWEPAQTEGGRARILYAGRISAGRGVRLLAAAVGKLRAERPVQLVLAGPVDEAFQPLVDEAIARAGLKPEDVEALGPIDHDDMPRVIASSTVCVAPASPDSSDRPLAGFPTKLLEYMACRRPVVAPRRSSVEEVIRDGEEGLLFAPGDAAELAFAIARLLDDAALRDKCAEAGYRRVRLEHPASATRRRLLEAYALLLPASTWAAPGRAASPIDALPSHPDTTTARRPALLVNGVEGVNGVDGAAGRTSGERSGEIVIRPEPAREIKVVPGEIVIEALDFAEAGEPFDATLDSVTSTPPATPQPQPQPQPQPRDAVPEPFDEAFSEEQRTRPFGRPFSDDPLEDEKTRPGPLRTRRTSE